MRLYLLRGFSLFAVFSWLAVLPFTASAASIVYDNTAVPATDGSGNQLYYSSANEFGDEITLDPASTARTMSALTFYYFYDGTSAGNATLRLYDNSGVGGAPGTLLDTSPLAPLPVPATAGHQGSLTWDLSGAIPQVTVPNTFTWTIQFSGLSGTAGLLVYGPPTVGSSFNDFWEDSGGTWSTHLISGGAVPGDFAARVTAVPEPGTLALGVTGLLAVVASAGYRRLRR